MSKKVLLSGHRGNLGRCFLDFFKQNHPDFKVEILAPSPFSLEKLAAKLQSDKPDYFINCAALTFNGDSIGNPYEFFDTNSFGVLNQLEMIRKFSPLTRYVSFGSVYEGTHNSPYASSKRVSRELVQNYRRLFLLFSSIYL